jgi:hypothetical protein
VTKYDEIGGASAWGRLDEGAYRLHPSEYERLKKEWMAGTAFFVGRDLYGDEIVLKLGSISAITRTTPAAIAERTAEQKTAAAEEALGS